MDVDLNRSFCLKIQLMVGHLLDTDPWELMYLGVDDSRTVMTVLAQKAKPLNSQMT